MSILLFICLLNYVENNTQRDKYTREKKTHTEMEYKHKVFTIKQMVNTTFLTKLQLELSAIRFWVFFSLCEISDNADLYSAVVDAYHSTVFL